ncbi:DNA-3-methyladenine glycosylase family protein [Burkholderia stagnalis]|uniref:DNA-3-methyladenine glycosylase family protein n=1 Tax=Burkholderia stagnalis TaxID=1503054 RepID=UPI00075DD993|nr:AlkA N-terminal domain-containing protein [Burkholderia stagnalis]KVN60048.1 3-methyladenine DNA glycosylase 2 [Burkholderia stagnalis]KVO49607.1 3-methyladenine DNA glycosylase 2 [Burkholderia stagnalis]KVP13630.1 3-methyladenine DNA glycosylase 2 [Burkholderia stagnalis]KVW91134.1 3-methyladenine DNA glycosylase 2 [Burkholderia stagnalis]KWH76321.1 3-methyladenine DNA glycosylase 2 [Burkholderia stagnalis]
MSVAITRTTTNGGDALPAAQLELRFKAPYDWARVLRFFSGRAIPGVEQVADGVYRRIVDLHGAPGRLTVARHPRKHCLVVTVAGPAARHVDDAFAARIAAMFDLRADPAAIGGELARDPWFAPLVAAAPGLRVPGAWSGFELAVRAIVGQQVSVKAATTIVGRLVERAGERVVHDDDGAPAWRFPTPDALAACDLARIGMPGKRAAALSGMARAVAAGDVPVDPAQADLAALRQAWLDLPGIGPWTVEYIAMRAWRDPDAWPASDLVLMQSIAARDPSLDRLASQKRRTDGWRPWRAYAALHLWNEVADRAGAARGG